MNINFSEIKNYFNTGYQIAIEQGGKFYHRSVCVLTQASSYIRQDKYMSIATVLMANILFFEIAARVMDLADKTFSKGLGLDIKNRTVLNTKSVVLVTFFTGLVAGMNVGLQKGLRLPLSSLQITGISLAVFGNYVLFRMYLASGKNQVIQE